MSANNPQPDKTSEPQNNNDPQQDHVITSQSPIRRPVQRDRTPSIIVQSLELSFNNNNKELAASQQHYVEEAQGPATKDEDSSSDSNNDATAAPCSDLRRASINEQPSAAATTTTTTETGSMASLHHNNNNNSSSPKPVGIRHQQSTTGNRRLSLTIGSTAPRRLSLTVDGMSSFINPAYKDLPAAAAASSAAAAYSSGSSTGSLRNKVALKPGHSLMGWVKLASTAKDLSGTNGKIIEVSPEELAKHDKEEDCWVAIKGNVYNVTTYLQYHPGGVEELMRGAGKEITDLFNEVHCWVNYESILAKCLVGPYKMESPIATIG